jgi:hypothetical protein
VSIEVWSVHHRTISTTMHTFEEGHISLDCLVVKAIAEEFILISPSNDDESTSTLAIMIIPGATCLSITSSVPAAFYYIQCRPQCLVDQSFSQAGIFSIVQFDNPDCFLS